MPSTIQGRELLDFIEQLGELAWLKFESRYPTISIKGSESLNEDRSARPPYTSFRFKHENLEIIERLRQAIENYQGNIEWIMEGHQRASFPDTTNWTICPKRVADIRQIALDLNLTSGQYMAEREPEFGPMAYEDLVRLTENLRNIFNKQKP